MNNDEELRALQEQADLKVRQFYVVDANTGTIRLTKTGMSECAARFAKAGINIHEITTLEQLKSAWARSQWVELDEIRTMVQGHPALETALAKILN
jgi:hypothetical protein